MSGVLGADYSFRLHDMSDIDIYGSAKLQIDRHDAEAGVRERSVYSFGASG